MILATAIFGGLILFNVLGVSAVESIQEKIDISVYFRSNVSEDYILDMRRSLEGLSEVRDVEYVSRERALAEFKETHADDETIIQALEELEENPLLASLNIKAWDPREYEAIAGYLDNPAFQDSIEKVTFAQNEIVINRLIALVDTVRKGGISLTVFMAFLAVAVTFNTIRLAIFSNREQISIVRLVGASNSLVRGPFIVEGLIYGIVAAALSFALLIPVINFVSPYLNTFIPEFNMADYFRANFSSLLFYQLAFAIGLGILSSIIAVRRYLRV